MNLGTWNKESLHMPGALKALIPQMQQYKMHSTAIQKTR
jgi:hypothetical protein